VRDTIRVASTETVGRSDCRTLPFSTVEPRKPVPSWQPGRFVWPSGRTKLVLFGGVGSRTGETEKSFGGLLHYLSINGGYDLRRDVLEGTFAGEDRPDGWRPRPYVAADTRRPLLDLAESVAGCLEWYRDQLPAQSRLCVLGYSLGGVAALDGSTLALVRDRPGWHNRLSSIITLAAPVRGCNAGPLINWAWLVTAEPDALGEAGRDLDMRWRDQEEQERLTRRAAFVRAAGIDLLTLADPDDAVVRPDEALLPAPGEPQSNLLVNVKVVRPGTLGHGAILDEPAVWRRIMAQLGPQEVEVGPPDEDPIDAELAALKARLRSEGRLK
jgi:hypothetical protein